MIEGCCHNCKKGYNPSDRRVMRVNIHSQVFRFTYLNMTIVSDRGQELLICKRCLAEMAKAYSEAIESGNDVI